MTASPHVRPRAPSRRAAAGRPALGAAFLVVLLAVLPCLVLLPGAPGAVRVSGVSLAWWYGGLVAPLLGWVVAIWSVGRPGGDAVGLAEPSPAAPRASG